MTRSVALEAALCLALATSCGGSDGGDPESGGAEVSAADGEDEGRPGATRGGGTKSFEIVGKVVFGDATDARFATSVGTIDVARCFAVIPEYQEIQGGKASTASASYHFYLQKANQRLQSAVKSVARERSLLLVVEQGGVRGDVELVDLTEPVLSHLGSR
jgi:hypothetical protein